MEYSSTEQRTSCSGCFYVHNVITVIAFPLKAMDSADAYPTCWRFYYDVLKQMSSEEQFNGYITAPVFPDGKNITSE